MKDILKEISADLLYKIYVLSVINIILISRSVCSYSGMSEKKHITVFSPRNMFLFK